MTARLRPYMLSLALLGSVIAAPVHAPAQSKAEIEKAKGHFKQGKEAYQKKRYDEAAEEFQKAYDLTGRAELLYNIGQAYRFAEKYPEAEKYLQRYLKDAPDAPNGDEVVQTIVEIQQQMAARMATVSVETDPAGAAVLIDDEAKARCTTPCTVMLQPGAKQFTLRAEGMRDDVRTMELEVGKTFELQATLRPAIVAGGLLVTSDREATVRVGEQQAELPLAEPLQLEPGSYTVSVEASHNALWKGDVVVNADETTELFIPMEALSDAQKRGGIKRGLAYGLLGVGAASGVATIFMSRALRGTFEELELQQSERGFASASLVQKGRAQQTTTNVMLGVTAGALVTGITLFLLDELID